MHKLQSIHPKQNQKQHMKAINYTCVKLEEKTTKSVKKNKNNFTNVTGDKFAVSIRQGKLTILFCKKLFSCINYLQLLKYTTK